MTSKETERKALEQIRKIVEGLGEDSYIGMAFDGCFEIAQENIDNDWGCSMRERFEKAYMDDERHCAELNEAKIEINTLKKMFADSEENTKHFRTLYENKCDESAQRAEEIHKRDSTIQQLNSEIMKLKAKLYDMMMEKVGE